MKRGIVVRTLLLLTMICQAAPEARAGRDDDDDEDPILIVPGDYGALECLATSHLSSVTQAIERVNGVITKMRYTLETIARCTYRTSRVYPMKTRPDGSWIPINAADVDQMAADLVSAVATGAMLANVSVNLELYNAETITDHLEDEEVTGCVPHSNTLANPVSQKSYLNHYWANSVNGDNIPAIKTMLFQSPNPAGGAWGMYHVQRKMTETFDCTGTWNEI